MSPNIFALDTGKEIDVSRLERGLSLEATPVGEGQYRVVGGREAHWVDLRTPNHPRCDCGDYLWREVTCKHILTALLYEGTPEVIGAVGKLVRGLRDEASALKRSA